MGTYSKMVYSGYIRTPDEGSILRAHGFDLRCMNTELCGDQGSFHHPEIDRIWGM